MKRNRSITYSNENPIYFITTTVTEKLPVFFDEGLCKIVLNNLNFYRDKLGFAIYAYVIMPTHIHLLVQQLGDKNISDFMRDFKSFSAKRIIDHLKTQVKAGALTLTIPEYLDVSTYQEKLLNHTNRVNAGGLTSAHNPLDRASQGPALTEMLNLQMILKKFENSASRYHKQKTGSVNQLWQERFDDVLIWSEKQFNVKFDYIHDNPTHEKWRLVDEPQEYKYSSARNYELDDESVFKIDRLEI
jgi:REP element-mobilizing transposase RayT